MSENALAARVNSSIRTASLNKLGKVGWMSRTALEKRSCSVCGKEFLTKHPQQKYCSISCQKKSYAKRHSEHIKSHSRERYLKHKQVGMYQGEVFYRDYKLPLKPVENGHGYYGTVGADDSGSYLQCHVCGKFYEGLGLHAWGEHRMTAEEYREKYELAADTALVGERLRASLIKKALSISHEERQRRMQKALAARKGGKIAQKTSWSLERKNREGRCPDQLVEKIVSLADKLGKTPTVADFEKEYGGFYSSIKSTFGNWNNALKVAGITPNKRKRRKDELLNYLRVFYKEHGRTPTSSDMRRGLLPNDVIYRNHFKSLNHAREQAGIPLLLRGPNRWMEVEPTSKREPYQLKSHDGEEVNST